MMTNAKKRGMGWLPDYPDFRDYTEDNEEIQTLLQPAPASRTLSGRAVTASPRRAAAKTAALPAAADLRPWCSPVEDQGSLGSCTAHAGVGIIEYYERKAFGRHIDASRLFLYKVTRNLMKAKGDTGAYLRTTTGAMVLFGVPPEEYWPYTDDEKAFDLEPGAFNYAFAANYQTLKYFRHDPPNTDPGNLLNKLKTYLAKGHPAMFGFTVYNSIEQADKTGRIPYPSPKEKIDGGHAVVAMGYDDKMKIRNKHGKAETTGALLIRNSWGTGWGENGYGWLPYEYILKGLAEDFWTILKKEWIDTGAFAE
jgi:C1A family cysteine protease